MTRYKARFASISIRLNLSTMPHNQHTNNDTPFCKSMAAELEAALARALEHVEEKTQHLRDTEGHMEHFRRIGLAAESSLETLRAGTYKGDIY